MRRILQVMAAGDGGGAVHLLQMLPALRRLGVESEAAVSEMGPLRDKLVEAGFPVHGLDLFRSRADATAPARLARVIREIGPDLVHYHGTRAAFFGALARPWLRPNPPAFYTVHGLSYRKESYPFRKSLFLAAEGLACRAANEVISVSMTDLEDLRRRHLLGKLRGRHIRNPVDGNVFFPGDRALARERLGIPTDAFVVGTVSRLVPQKSVRDLIDAASRLPRATVVIVGDGPQRPALERMAEPLRGRTRFLGERDDVAEVLRAFDVFVLCSRWEGEPIVLLEAMATSVPCVAAANSAARELLEENGSGRLFPVGDTDELVASIEELAAHPDRATAMGEAGRRAVRGRGPDALAKTVLAAYETCW